MSPNGTIGVSFYDTRNDSTGKKTDQYFTFSSDGGLTWAPNVKVTSAQSDESGSGDPNDYGDYQNIAASATNWFAPVWTDSRRPGAHNRLLQGTDNQLRFHLIRHCPTHDAARVQVQPRCQVRPTAA